MMTGLPITCDFVLMGRNVAFGTIAVLHLFFYLTLDKACPGDNEPIPRLQGFFAAPSRRRERSDSRVRVYAGLLKCNCWGVADGILESDHRTGDASGAGASGQTVAAHGKLIRASPTGYLVARWIFVWVSEPVSVCITPGPKIHAPVYPPRRVYHE